MGVLKRGIIGGDLERLQLLTFLFLREIKTDQGLMKSTVDSITIEEIAACKVFYVTSQN